MPAPFKPRVLLASHFDRDVIAEPIERLRTIAEVVDAYRGRCLTTEELLACIPGCHAVVAADEQYSADVLDHAAELVLIARDGMGYDAIDLEAATERGILVTRAPVLHHATANMTMGMMIALVRKLTAADRSVRENPWEERHHLVTPDLTGMTLGIIGFGQVGREVARRAVPFGMEILVFNPSDVSAAASQLGARTASINEVLANSDVVSLHCRHSAETVNMFNADLFGRMKKGSYLVNTARGGLVDESALAAALESGHLAGAALDVFATEPVPADNPLLAFENVLCAPHIAGDTSTTMLAAVDLAVQLIADCFAGKRPENLLNPDTWEQARIHNIRGD